MTPPEEFFTPFFGSHHRTRVPMPSLPTKHAFESEFSRAKVQLGRHGLSGAVTISATQLRYLSLPWNTAFRHLLIKVSCAKQLPVLVHP